MTINFTVGNVTVMRNKDSVSSTMTLTNATSGSIQVFAGQVNAFDAYTPNQTVVVTIASSSS